MTKCKWCGSAPAVTKSGYCRDCNQLIRDEILKRKARLEELAKGATPDLSGEEKNAIFFEIRKIKGELQVYKDERVPFFKTEISEWTIPVLTALGLNPTDYPDIVGNVGNASIACPYCGSTNVTLHDYRKKIGNGISFWLIWIPLALFTCGVALLAMAFFAASPTQEERKTIAVCHKCGRNFEV